VFMHDSDQLRLELGMPWNGVSPRYLTRAPRKVSFVRSGTGRPDPEASVAVQLELFPEGTSYGT